MEGDLLASPVVEQPARDDASEVNDPQMLSRRAEVKRWQERVLKAKGKFKEDFTIMRQNMDFVANYQWDGQVKRNDKRYKANFILRLVKQKVAQLYAKDPTTEFKRQERMDFAVWDEKVESLMSAVQQAAEAVMMGGFAPPETMAIIDDYQQGKQWQELIDRYGRTLKILYRHQLDTQEPEFKQQVKDAVDRTCVCGVSYARINYCSYNTKEVSKSIEQPSDQDRMAHAREILRQVDEGEVEMDDAQVETLRNLVSAIGGTVEEGQQKLDHLSFDFPPATTIIPDPRCRRLKGFIGARWVAQEYVLPLEFVNAFFGTKITGTGDVTSYHEDGSRDEANTGEGENKTDRAKEPQICVWEIIDKSTESRCIICDGHKDYLLEPEMFEPVGRVFWPWFPLVFNAVETDKGCKASIFPPSDVELGTPQQKEWNRTRDGLRGQRRANAPKYLYAKGQVDVEDVKKIVNAEPNQCLAVNLPPSGKLSDLMVPLQVAQIDPAVYDTEPIKEDLLLATGAQEANIGPAQPNVTATNSTIAEQSRVTVAASNVDDLDEWLSCLAYYGGGLMARRMDRETVIAVVGRGATWPDADKDLFANEIFLTTISGSSGRPNVAMEMNKASQIIPLLLQSGANPIAVIRWLVKLLDVPFEETEFFPVMPSAPPGGAGQPGMGGEQEQSQLGAPGETRQNGEAQMHPSGVRPMERGTAEVSAAA